MRHVKLMRDHSWVYKETAAFATAKYHCNSHNNLPTFSLFYHLPLHANFTLAITKGAYN